MKLRQHIVYYNAVIGIVLCLLLFSNESLQAQENTAVRSDLNIRFYYTCDGEVKANRNFTIEAEIENQGEDFSGRLQVIFPREANENSIAIEKPFSVKQGEKVCEKMTLFLDSEIPGIQVQVIDSYKQTVAWQKKTLIFTQNSDTLYVASISDKPESLRYMGELYQESVNAKNFSLTERPLPEEEKEYDMYDVIVVNDYDLTSFGTKQIQALKSWIENGGSFLLGADTFLDKNLSLFTDELDIKEVGKSRQGMTDLGLFPEDMEQIRKNIIDKNRRNVNEFVLSPVLTERRDVSIQGASILQADEDGIILQEISYGSGLIQVAGINLALHPGNWYGMGTGILHLIYNNVSDSKAVQMNRESYRMMYYPIYRSIDFKEKQVGYPIVGYIIVYALYVVVIGPVLYIVLKKKEKREWYWLFVPVTSVLFTIIIYIMGSSTRSPDQYVGYFSMLTMDASGKGEKEDIFMSESAKYKKYSLLTHKDSEIMPMLNYMNGKDAVTCDASQDFKMLVRMEEDQIVCDMNEYALFEKAYFRANKKVPATHPNTNYYQSDFLYDRGKLQGTVVTNLGYDLENACILTGNTVTAVGTVKNQIPLRIGDQNSQRLGSQSDLYSSQIEDGSILQEITGYQMSSVPKSEEEYRSYCRFQLLSYYIEQNLHAAGSYLVGFSAQPKNNDINERDVVTNGENLIILPLSVSDTEGKNGILSLDPYKTIRKGSWNLEDRLIGSNTLDVMYSVPEHIKINQIQYTEQFNGEINSQSENEYVGMILLYNNRTRKYDEIFTGQTEGILTDIEDYVNSYNQIWALYQPDADKPCILPVLSVATE